MFPFGLAISFMAVASAAPSTNLGSGEPGLKIIYKTPEQFAIFLDEPWTVGPSALGGEDKRHIEVLSDQNYGFKEKVRSQMLSDFPEQMYALASSTNGIVVSDDVYSLARSLYRLTTNQLFLGKLETNIYYWEIRDPKRIYYRTAWQTNAAHYFELPKGIIDIYGVTKAAPKKDHNIEIVAFGKSAGFFHTTPYQSRIIGVSFEHARGP
jgi:hypothetical protein